jgi:hypothetical protein
MRRREVLALLELPLMPARADLKDVGCVMRAPRP